MKQEFKVGDKVIMVRPQYLHSKNWALSYFRNRDKKIWEVANISMEYGNRLWLHFGALEINEAGERCHFGNYADAFALACPLTRAVYGIEDSDNE